MVCILKGCEKAQVFTNVSDLYQGVVFLASAQVFQNEQEWIVLSLN